MSKKNRELKESFRMINSQRIDTKKVNPVQEGKKIGIEEIIKHNEIINKSLECRI